jgi:hypothetical protein
MLTLTPRVKLLETNPYACILSFSNHTHPVLDFVLGFYAKTNKQSLSWLEDEMHDFHRHQESKCFCDCEQTNKRARKGGDLFGIIIKAYIKVIESPE